MPLSLALRRNPLLNAGGLAGDKDNILPTAPPMESVRSVGSRLPPDLSALALLGGC